MNVLERPIILGSKSPRRSQLLRDAGFSNFEVRTRDVDESFPPEMPAASVAEFVARNKAEACRDFLTDPDIILLTADSVVILDEVVYGKPTDFEDAFRIIRNLAGRTHTVITGVCLLSSGKEISFSGVSQVTIEAMSDEEIAYYIHRWQPFDKAGAYAIQEWIGLCKISKIEGTFTNVMGLPVDLVYRALMNW